MVRKPPWLYFIKKLFIYSLKTLTSFRDHRPYCQAKHTTMIEKNQKIGLL